MAIRFSKNLGLLLTGVWLMLTGVFSLFEVSFRGQGLLMGILALLAGVLVILEYRS